MTLYIPQAQVSSLSIKNLPGKDCCGSATMMATRFFRAQAEALHKMVVTSDGLFEGAFEVKVKAVRLPWTV